MMSFLELIMWSLLIFFGISALIYCFNTSYMRKNIIRRQRRSVNDESSNEINRNTTNDERREAPQNVFTINLNGIDNSMIQPRRRSITPPPEFDLTEMNDLPSYEEAVKTKHLKSRNNSK